MADALTQALVASLDAGKAMDIQVFDVRRLTAITDFMIVASGRSDRQVRALADKLIETAKGMQFLPLGVEGHDQGEWILVDLGDVVAHIMHPTTRAYYQLEKLWNSQQPRKTHSG